jgi:alanine racemase
MEQGRGRPAQARIDLEALRHNYRVLRHHHGGRALAVLKADGYGHGATRCARALTGLADAFAVAIVEEALALRKDGIQAPILVLEGAFDAAQLLAASQAGLWMVVHQRAQLAMLDALPEAARLPVWLKLDTGMHRAGFDPAEAAAVYRQLREHPRVADDLTLMSHLARADEPDAPATPAQVRCFDAATQGLAGARSLANSAGVLGWPETHRDWARPGIALYGADPMPAAFPGLGADLCAVMRLTSEVFAVREVAAGEAVGYGGTWTATRPSRLGLIAMGYADGFPRTVAAGTPLLVAGRPCPLAGRVSMDMLAVDLTDHPALSIGAEVECWGPALPVNDVAAAADTISYELLCGVKRVAVAEGRGQPDPRPAPAGRAASGYPASETPGSGR